VSGEADAWANRPIDSETLTRTSNRGYRISAGQNRVSSRRQAGTTQIKLGEPKPRRENQFISIRMFALSAAVAAIASMALVSVSPAQANFETAICETDTAASCPSPASLVTFHQVGTSFLINNTTVLRLSGKIEGHVEGGNHLARPLGLEILTLNFTQCGTNAAHSNCTVITIVKGLLDVLKEALNFTATLLGTKVLTSCAGLHCVYGPIQKSVVSPWKALSAGRSEMVGVIRTISAFICARIAVRPKSDCKATVRKARAVAVVGGTPAWTFATHSRIARRKLQTSWEGSLT